MRVAKRPKKQKEENVAKGVLPEIGALNKLCQEKGIDVIPYSKFKSIIKKWKSAKEWTLQEKTNVIQHILDMYYDKSKKYVSKKYVTTTDLDCIDYAIKKFSDCIQNINVHRYSGGNGLAYQIFISLHQYGYNFREKADKLWNSCNEPQMFAAILGGMMVRDDDDSDDTVFVLDTLFYIDFEIIKRNKKFITQLYLEQCEMYKEYVGSDEFITYAIPKNISKYIWFVMRTGFGDHDDKWLYDKFRNLNRNKKAFVLDTDASFDLDDDELLTEFIIRLLERKSIKPSHTRNVVFFALDILGRDFSQVYPFLRNRLQSDSYDISKDLLLILAKIEINKVSSDAKTMNINNIILCCYYHNDITEEDMLRLFLMGYGGFEILLLVIKSESIDYDKFFDRNMRRIAYMIGNHNSKYSSGAFLRDLKIEPNLSDVSYCVGSETISLITKTSIISDSNVIEYLQRYDKNSGTKITKISTSMIKEAIVRFYDSLDLYTKSLMSQILEDRLEIKNPFDLCFVLQYNPTITYEYMEEFVKLGQFKTLIKVMMIYPEYGELQRLLDISLAVKSHCQSASDWIMNQIQMRDYGKTIYGQPIEFEPIEEKENILKFVTSVDPTFKKSVTENDCLSSNDVIKKYSNNKKSKSTKITTNVLDAQHPSTNMLAIIEQLDGVIVFEDNKFTNIRNLRYVKRSEKTIGIDKFAKNIVSKKCKAINNIKFGKDLDSEYESYDSYDDESDDIEEGSEYWDEEYDTEIESETESETESEYFSY